MDVSEVPPSVHIPEVDVCLESDCQIEVVSRSAVGERIKMCFVESLHVQEGGLKLLHFKTFSCHKLFRILRQKTAGLAICGLRGITLGMKLFWML